MTGNLILPSIVAIAAFLLCMVVMQVMGRRESARERLQRFTSGGAAAPQENDLEDPLRQNQDMSPLAVVLEQVMRLIGINTEAYRKNTQMRFYRAGIQSLDGPIYFLFFKRIGFLLFLAMAFMFISKGGTGTTRLLHWMIAILLAAIGLLGPDLLLTNRREKREKILQRSFPDALDLLLVCVESGLALDGALSRVCKELGRAHPDITLELNRTRLELTLLNDRAQALANLAERTDMLAFRSLVTTLLQSEKFGTSLTDTLRVLSEDFRHTRLMLAEEKAARLPVLMTIPLILLLIPALFLIILGPAMINVMHAMAGN